MHGGHTKCIVATQNTRHFLLESFVWEEAIHVPGYRFVGAEFYSFTRVPYINIPGDSSATVPTVSTYHLPHVVIDV